MMIRDVSIGSKLVLLALVLLPAAGCNGDPVSMGPMGPVFDRMRCRADVLQPDLVSQGPDGMPLDGIAWSGPGVDGATGLPIVPAGALVATTYLQLRTSSEAQAAFGEIAGPVAGTLQSAPGLVAVSLASSSSCATVRTLSIWENEDALIAFVASDAHATAIMRVAEVSRGGSITTHWTAASDADGTWEMAAQRLAAHEGPVY